MRNVLLSAAAVAALAAAPAFAQDAGVDLNETVQTETDAVTSQELDTEIPADVEVTEDSAVGVDAEADVDADVEGEAAPAPEVLEVTEANVGSDVYFNGEVVGQLSALSTDSGEATITLAQGGEAVIEPSALILSDDGSLVAAVTEAELQPGATPAADADIDAEADAEADVDADAEAVDAEAGAAVEGETAVEGEADTGAEQ